MKLPVVAGVWRGDFLESVHSGSLLVRRGDGSTVLAVGEVESPVLPRSSNKPLQAVALLELGWKPSLGAQLALACASHNGEADHLLVVRQTLAEAGLGEADLRCPPALPLHEPTAQKAIRAGDGPTAISMNCSGKHAAMLATARAIGAPTDTYLDPDHPVQAHIRTTIECLAGEPVASVVVDGCGAPQHAISLRGLSNAFAAIATAPLDTPAGRVAAAMRANPWQVGGTGRDVTRLMEAVPGLIAKDGAEAVYAAALPDGASVVCKIADGGSRARTPLLVAGLRLLGIDAPADLAEGVVLGGGKQVGAVRAILPSRAGG